MRYFVTVAGQTIEVELTASGAVIDGKPVNAELHDLPGTTFRHLLVDGRSVPLVLSAGEQRGVWDVHIDGRRYQAEVLDERSRAIREMTGAVATPRGLRPVRAPMPGLVVRIDVEPGQAVRAGQGMVIVEAMKMENELKAEAAGVVARILVRPGQAVEKGTVLVEFGE
jgi:pyruvate carboxylase subunit B